MTPADLSAALTALGWSQRELARQLGCAESSVRQWLTGKARMRADLAAWVLDLARYHVGHPAPDAPRAVSGMRNYGPNSEPKEGADDEQ